MSEANKYQVDGNHYSKYGDLQPWDLWMRWKLNAFQATILHYIVRYRDKDGLKDLEKAKHVLEKLIEEETAGRGDLPIKEEPLFKCAFTTGCDMLSECTKMGSCRINRLILPQVRAAECTTSCSRKPVCAAVCWRLG